jgi:hypothetical protein
MANIVFHLQGTGSNKFFLKVGKGLADYILHIIHVQESIILNDICRYAIIRNLLDSVIKRVTKLKN